MRHARKIFSQGSDHWNLLAWHEHLLAPDYWTQLLSNPVVVLCWLRTRRIHVLSSTNTRRIQQQMLLKFCVAWQARSTLFLFLFLFPGSLFLSISFFLSLLCEEHTWIGPCKMQTTMPSPRSFLNSPPDRKPEKISGSKHHFIDGTTPIELLSQDLRLIWGIFIMRHKKGAWLVSWWRDQLSTKGVIKTTLVEISSTCYYRFSPMFTEGGAAQFT